MEGPCRDCTRREITCHSTCKEYQQYKSTQDEKKARIRQNKALYEITDPRIQGRYTTMRKFKKRYVKEEATA